MSIQSWASRRTDTDMTYREFQRQIAAEFSSRYSDAKQTPQFHASIDKLNHRVFGAGMRPVYANVIVGGAGGLVWVDEGVSAGIAPGDVYQVFKDLKALEAGQPLARGVVEQVEVSRAAVRLTARVDILAGMIAQVSPDGLRRFPLALIGEADAALTGELERLQREGQLSLASDPSQAAVVLRLDPVRQRAELFWPTEVPGGEPRASGGPARPVLTALASATEKPPYATLLRNLLYLQQVNRFLSLSMGSEEIGVQPRISNERGDLLDALPEVAGVYRLKDGDRVALTLTNRGKLPMNLYLFVVNKGTDPGAASFRIVRLYPANSGEDVAIPARQAVKVGPFRAGSAGGVERTTLKLIASTTPIRFDTLVRPPGTGLRRGGLTPAESFLEEVLHGSGQVRGDEPRISAQTIVLDVERN